MGNTKLFARETRIYSIEKVRRRYFLKDLSYCLGYRIFVTVFMEMKSPLITDFKKRIEIFVT